MEGVLWRSRLLVAVLGGIIPSAEAFYLGTADVVRAIGDLVDYSHPSLSSAEREEVSSDALTTIVKAVDEYLIAAILPVFALGLYELFIGRIGAVERTEVAGRLLLIESLDDLKGGLASPVLMVLTSSFSGTPWSWAASASRTCSSSPSSPCSSAEPFTWLRRRCRRKRRTNASRRPSSHRGRDSGR